MKVASINTAAVSEIQYRGESFPTGIFKRPVSGPLSVSPEGVVGDTTSDLVNHGGSHKAVYGFSLAHYPYWCEALGRSELPAGSFGENLTISDLDEEAVCIGDQLSIGTAVLEVSQPRVPCFKLGIALEDERAPALFTRHFHTGVYFRVVTAGTISSGDEVSITHRHKARLSVHSLFRAMFDKNFPDEGATFERAALIGELAPEWQKKVQRRLNQGTSE